MTVIVYDNFKPSLMDMNPNVYYVYVESAKQQGGSADVVHLRNNDKGLPVTLVERYLQEGMSAPLSHNTEARDIRVIEYEFQKINYVTSNGGVVCVPSRTIHDQIICLEKSSPTMAGYVLKRFEHLMSNHSPVAVELPS